MIPAEYRGAWRRSSLTLGDGEPFEPQQVIWLQAADAFADLRLPLVRGGDVNCFAGTTTFRPAKHGASARLHWNHEVGMDPPGSADEGDVEWSGGELIERGVFVIDGVPTPYIEVWHREADSDGVHLSLRSVGEGSDGAATVIERLVQVGDHALTVADHRPTGGSVTACYRRRAGCGPWLTALDLAGGAESTAAPPSPITLASATAGDSIELDGRTWQVDEVAVGESVP